MTAASIAAGQAASYSAYLESRTVAPSRGDYYLSAEGEPTEAPGIWHLSAATRERLGLVEGEPVRAGQLVALMEGRHPGHGGFIRQAGSDGRRAGGIDLTFSAPKSVSAVWALGSAGQRAGVEAAHGEAVARALAHLRLEVPVVREGAGGVRLALAADLVAAEFRHATARGVDGGVPDPQLHSHTVLMGVVRGDGRFAAVASRPLFRAARELGAVYRAELALQLREQGYGIEAGTGRERRYFEIAGVGEQVRGALSGRSREVWLAAERFRARYGRAPRRGELRNVKLENRRAKTPQTRPELQAAWRARVQGEGFDASYVQALQGRRAGAVRRQQDGGWRARLAGALTGQRATFSAEELRAGVLEQGLGELEPRRVGEDVGALVSSGAVIELEDGRFTTREIRVMERAVEDRLANMAAQPVVRVGERERRAAAIETGERIGASLSVEQQHALELITGAERVAVLVGQAGAGKGVVIDAAARAEQLAGRRTLGVAVSGSVAERLGTDSPALQERTSTLDALVARVKAGSVRIDADTTVFFDEAGMADTRRLEALSRVVDKHAAKLILIGDAGQLASIGPGGLFERASKIAPTAQLAEVRRTEDPQERRAWADLRAGRTERAMAHYQARGQLHFAESREQAIEAAVKQWADLAERHGAQDVALISDASTVEIDRMNARAQHLRGLAGQLGEQEIPLPDVPYGLRAGDRVAFIAQHHPTDGARVENGTRCEVAAVDVEKEALSVICDGSDRHIELTAEQLGVLRLGYAQHLYRQQGATVQRTVCVTGGWQASRQGAYVQASRARNGTDWHLSRQDLGSEGIDADRVARFAQLIRASRAQIPSIAIPALDPQDGIAAQLARSTDRQLHRDKHLLQRQAGMSL